MSFFRSLTFLRNSPANRRSETHSLLVVLALTTLAWAACLQPVHAESITIQTLAGGTRGNGDSDGTVTQARYFLPMGLFVDSTGNVYVADTGNHSIRKVNTTGTSSTLAGLSGGSGSLDGVGYLASFLLPGGVAADASGNVYVADTGNSTIRKIAPGLIVTTFAGTAGVTGSTDGTGASALFSSPTAVATDTAGNVYVADSGNFTVRKITPAGVVTTLAGTAGTTGSADGAGNVATFGSLPGIAVDSTGRIYVSDSNHTIRRITPAGAVTTLAGLAATSGLVDATGNAARFNTPRGISVDSAFNVYVADFGNDAIRKVTTAGVVSTVVATVVPGNPNMLTNQNEGPNTVAVDSAGNLYITDSFDNAIRKATPAGVLSAFSGITDSGGRLAQAGTLARFNSPAGTTVDLSGNVYVADTFNSVIRKITPLGAVTTFAGFAGATGNVDGTGSQARFFGPYGVAADGMGNVYVADSSNNTIRKISPTGSVTTLAGSQGVAGSADGLGTAATFNFPTGIAATSTGTLYVADYGNSTIRKITSGGLVTTLAGSPGVTGAVDGAGAAARFTNPVGVAVDSTGIAYVADSGNHAIRKVTAAGAVTTLAGTLGTAGFVDGTGTAAQFNSPYGIAADFAANLYVADTGNSVIRKITPAGVVDTLAGEAGYHGSRDGTGTDSQLYFPFGISVGSTGIVYVGDTYSETIRAGTTPIADTGAIDLSPGQLGVTRQLSVSPMTASNFTWRIFRRPAGSTAALSSGVIANPTFVPDVADLFVFEMTATGTAGSTITYVGLIGTDSNPVPVLTTLNPSFITGGGPSFTMTLTGTSFVAGAVVNWSGQADLTPLTQTTTQLTVQVPASYIATNGSASVTVTNPAPGGGVSNALTFTIGSVPVPTLTGISPTSAQGGGPAFTMTLTGTNFVSSSTVKWSGQPDLIPKGQTATTLSVTVPASYLTVSGTASITVFNPAPGGGTSNAQMFTVNPNPLPVLTSLSPQSVFGGIAGTTLTLSGSSFIASSVVNWPGQADLVPVTQSATQLTVQVRSSYLATAGNVNVTVTNPAPGGGVSAPQTFSVLSNPSPILTGISPTSVFAGSGAFTLTLTGSGFASISTVQWAGQADLIPVTQSDSQLTVQVPAGYIAAEGSASIQVFTPGPGGGTSFAQTLTIVEPAPGLTDISPNTNAQGFPGFTMTLTGSNFVSRSVVQWTGQPDLIPVTQSATQLTVQVPSTYIATFGTPTVTVFTPAPGGGSSPGLTFTIAGANPVATLTSLSPNQALAGSGDFTMTITGTNFIASSQVQWLGQANLALQSQTDTQLTVQVPAAYIASGGSATVTVFNPSPGGGASNSLTFTIAFPPPTISGISPVFGTTNGGTQVTLNGTNFAQGMTVTFDGLAATGVNVTSSTSVSCNTPAHAAGKVDVVATAHSQSATLTAGYRYTSHPGTNNPPVIASLPTAIPNPAVVGAPVAFSADATDADGDSLDYTWDFGDGNSGAGASVSNTYAAAGIYTATVSVSDGVATVSRSVDMAVNAAVVAEAVPFAAVKASIVFNFVKANADTLAISGTIPVSVGFNPAGKPVSVLIGSLSLPYTLTSKGVSTNKAFSLKGKLKNGVYTSGAATFTLALKGANLFAALSDLGFSKTMSVPNVTVPIIVTLNGEFLASSPTLHYVLKSSKKGPSTGTAKK